jgi:hypothetical protein
MEFKNEYIVIVIIIIITVFFIINYDVYVLPKNEPLCKPVYITKKTIDDKILKKIKNPKESFTTSKNKINQENEDILENEFIKEENINHNKNIIRKKIVINNILNILPKIPSVLNDEEIHFIINHISNIYLTSKNMDQFYNNIYNSDKITPNNTSYIKLILYLIDNFEASTQIDALKKPSLPINIDKQIIKQQINKPMENKIIKNNIYNKNNCNIVNENENENVNENVNENENENLNDDMFIIANSNSPIQNRMMQQASFLR